MMKPLSRGKVQAGQGQSGVSRKARRARLGWFDTAVNVFSFQGAIMFLRRIL